MKDKQFYRCDICGNLFGMVNDGGVVPICCGQPMTILEPNTTDGAGEKHVPVMERNGKRVVVRVGSVEHPMLDEHFIQWIMVMQGDHVQRVALRPGEAPEAVFMVDCETSPIAAYEYCNLHGLWRAEG